MRPGLWRDSRALNSVVDMFIHVYINIIFISLTAARPPGWFTSGMIAGGGISFFLVNSFKLVETPRESRGTATGQWPARWTMPFQMPFHSEGVHQNGTFRITPTLDLRF